MMCCAELVSVVLCVCALVTVSVCYVDPHYQGMTDCLYDFHLEQSWNANGMFRARIHLCRPGTACMVYKNDYLGYTGAPECVPLDSRAIERCVGDHNVAAKNCSSLTQWGNCCCVGSRCNYPDFDTIEKVQGIDRLEWRSMMLYLKRKGIKQPDVDQVVSSVKARRLALL